MERFPILDKGELDAEQRKLWDELTLGPRGFYTGGPEAERLPDLYNAWLQFPEFGELMLRLGDAIRARTPIHFTDFASGVAYMEFTEAVARSAQHGVAVTLPLDLEDEAEQP